MPEPNTKEPAKPNPDPAQIKRRLDTFVLGLLAAEVQRKGVGISPGGLGTIVSLAQKAILHVDEVCK